MRKELAQSHREIRRDIVSVVRQRGLVSVRELAQELGERDRHVRGRLELSIGEAVIADNVSEPFLEALRRARDTGNVEILITSSGAFLLPGRTRRLGFFRAALAQRQLGRLPLLRPNAL